MKRVTSEAINQYTEPGWYVKVDKSNFNFQYYLQTSRAEWWILHCEQNLAAYRGRSTIERLCLLPQFVHLKYWIIKIRLMTERNLW